jgi:hypothetical protein
VGSVIKLTIPEIRARLYVLAVELNCPELKELADATKRRPYLRRAAPTAKRIGPMDAAMIREYAANHLDESLQSIAEQFGVNQGRVSECLRGER